MKGTEWNCCPSIINLMVSVDVKHPVYLLTGIVLFFCSDLTLASVSRLCRSKCELFFEEKPINVFTASGQWSTEPESDR